MTLSARIVTAASNTLRSLGQSLDRAGSSLEVAKHAEQLVPSTRFVAVDGVGPTVSHAAFVAPNASVIGHVTLHANASVWYGATLRGDVHRISVGENSVIGDRAVVHVAKLAGDAPSLIGDNVSVGPGAIVHAATLKDNVVIGASAQVLDGAVVEANAVVAPGSIVTPGTVVSEGELWSGVPAERVRRLTAEELSAAAEGIVDTLYLARMHADETSKDCQYLAKEEEYREDATTRDPDYYPYRDPEKTAPEEGDVLGMGSPGLIFDSVLTHPEEGLKLMHKRASKKQE